MKTLLAKSSCSALLAISGLACGMSAFAGPEPGVDSGSATGDPVDAGLSAAQRMDVEASIDDAVGRPGWSSRGDFRALFSSTDEDARDGTSRDTDQWIGRLRTELTWVFTPRLRASARLAGSCTDDDCSLEFVLENAISGSTLERGKITFDELFIHFFQSERFDVALGRLQTRLVTRAGVFAKSLDRADSDNAAINWTDGFHGTMRHHNGWESQLIVQYNDSTGASNVRRKPLDFSSSRSRITYVLALENTERWGPVVQRALDINYLPGSLQKDGTSTGRVEDYWGLVGRLAAEWPRDSSGMRMRIAGEVGYAPETQSKEAFDFSGSGDVDGLAWNVAASLLDVLPSHSIGINYGRIDPGWLLSPDFTDNEEQTEIRYRWTKSRDLTLEFRVRERNDIVRLESALRKRSRFDYFLRLTWRFALKTL